MACKECEQFFEEFKLKEKAYETITFEQWNRVPHLNLIDYADYNNGVSEGGSGMMCKTCFTFFDLHIHIAMDEDELFLEWVDEVEDWQIKEAATFLYAEKEAEKFRQRVNEKEKQTVYFVSDINFPSTYGYQTEEEETFMDLEIYHKFGLNHVKYHSYASLYLTLEETLKSLGTRDDYLKNTYILSFFISSDELNVYPLSSPYAETEVRMSTNEYIKKTRFSYVDILTNKEIPFTDVSYEELLKRNHEIYLEELKNQITHLPTAPPSDKENFINQMKEKIQASIS